MKFIPKTMLFCILAGILCSGAYPVDFLIPGVPLKSVSFEQGAMVEYLSISETFGVKDSSLVRIEVLEIVDGKVVMLICNSSYPPLPDESVRAKIIMSENIREMSSPSQYGKYIKEIYVRQGEEGYRQASQDDLDELDVGRLFIQTAEGVRELPPDSAEVETPAGSFSCRVGEYISSSAKKINLGGVEGHRKEEVSSKLWKSERVPFWGIVRSRVKRKSSTSIPGPSSLNELDSKVVLTESMLLSYRD